MENTTDLSQQINRLQRRVNLLTAGLIGTLILTGVLFVRGSQDTNIEARAVQADSIRCQNIEIRGADSDSDSIRISAGKAGSHLFFRDGQANNQVRLNSNGLTIGDTEGGHSIHLGLSPGPDNLHAPFMLLRDRDGHERASFALNAESDTPQFRMSGASPQTTLELSPSSMFVYSKDGATRARMAIADGIPELLLRHTEGDSRPNSLLLTPNTQQ